MAKPIIAQVLRDDAGRVEVRAALREAYPFGMKKYLPYQIWLDEIKRQIGNKPKLGSPKFKPNPKQINLF